MTVLHGSETMFSAADVSIHLIGTELQPVIVIDSFYPDSSQLKNLAEIQPPFSAQSTDFYPGLRKIITGDYPAKVIQSLDALIRKTFNLADSQQAHMNLSAFSLTTTPEHKLRPIQSVPHIDTHEANHFAVVHYLCDERYGGTSFYRHKSTGFECINDQRFKEYFRILKQEVISEASKPAYINGDTALFEKIYSVDVKFNRAVIYRSHSLHSGNINGAVGLSSDPRVGRLTANSFIQYSAAI